MKSYDVTIQMIALCLYFHMMLFLVKILENEIWKFARNLPLATFGSERVKLNCQWPKLGIFFNSHKKMGFIGTG